MKKHRLFVLTDISNFEPDDKESMVRLMLYANDIDIEGLVATSSIWLVKTKSPIAPELITNIVNAYANVRDNLELHRGGYPTAEYLHSLVCTGNENDMVAVGTGKETDGSNLLVAALEKDDLRPLWVAIWGGASTLAQALWTIREKYPPAAVAHLLRRLRIYDLAGQDDAGAWISHHFPGLFYLRSVDQWQGISYRVDKEIRLETRGGDQSLVAPRWFAENIIKDHGPLGEAYPPARFCYEGDTPTYLNLIPNGLTDPEQPHYGGWGGRFKRAPEKNVRAFTPSRKIEHPFDDYWMLTEDTDRWSWNDTVYDNSYCAVFRWREAFQNDFAARMDWCVKPVAEANHNPVAVVNGDAGTDIILLDAAPGETVVLDASESSDPDGDELHFTWWGYAEAGTYRGKYGIDDGTSALLRFTVPADAAGTSLHLVLSVRDAGSPPLYAYRRVVIRAR